MIQSDKLLIPVFLAMDRILNLIAPLGETVEYTPICKGAGGEKRGLAFALVGPPPKRNCNL
jgi:hypothetical protein